MFINNLLANRHAIESCQVLHLTAKSVSMNRDDKQMMKNTPSRLLIIDSEAGSLTEMQDYFMSEKYHVSTSTSGNNVQNLINEENIDLLLMDPYTSDIDGFEIIKSLKLDESKMGIILVSERCDNLDRILGLEMGADDYIPKPFSNRELLARVKSLLRRVRLQETNYVEHSTIHLSGWKIDELKRQLSSPVGENIALTRAEFELMLALGKHPNTMMTREHLMKHITHRHWTPDSRVVDTLIKRLRKKIELNPKEPDLIQTVYGEGYMLITENVRTTKH